MPVLSDFMISQILVGFAICFDVLSFQFKEKKHIVVCLFLAGMLISAHFMLLKNWTAALLMMIAVTRYFLSIFTASKILMYVLILSSAAATFITYNGVLSLFSLVGSCFQTVAAFSSHDKNLRKLMIIGTSFWLLHNYLAGSPTAVLMEIIFITSNLIGYYRFYIAPSKPALK